MAWVYCITFPNQKRYVGFESRKGGRKYDHKLARTKQVVHFAIRKHGWKNCSWQYLSEKLTKEEALALEEYYIKLWNLTDRKFGYNRSLGGESGFYGCHHSEESKRKLSEANKGRGKPCSEEAKRKIGEANSLKVRDDTFRRKVSEYHSGRKRSEETKRKISEAAKKRLRRVTSKATKEKLRITSRIAMLKRLGKLNDAESCDS